MSNRIQVRIDRSFSEKALKCFLAMPMWHAVFNLRCASRRLRVNETQAQIMPANDRPPLTSERSLEIRHIDLTLPPRWEIRQSSLVIKEQDCLVMLMAADRRATLHVLRHRWETSPRTGIRERSPDQPAITCPPCTANSQNTSDFKKIRKILQGETWVHMTSCSVDLPGNKTLHLVPT